MAGILGSLTNPFIPNPDFTKPEDPNFIQKGIADGIEKGLGKVGDNLIHAGQAKTDSFAHNLPELATLALICYLIYLGYMCFIRNGQNQEINYSRLYSIIMIYVIFKLFWHVVLKI